MHCAPVAAARRFLFPIDEACRRLSAAPQGGVR